VEGGGSFLRRGPIPLRGDRGSGDEWQTILYIYKRVEEYYTMYVYLMRVCKREDGEDTAADCCRGGSLPAACGTGKSGEVRGSSSLPPTMSIPRGAMLPAPESRHFHHRVR
jgi:hypothetical protein